MLKRLWGDIKSGKSLDLYILIVLSVALIVLNLVGIDLGVETSAVILALLALLGVSLLRLRQTIDDLRSAPRGATRFLHQYPPEYEQGLESANEVLLVGVTLNSVLRQHRSMLAKKLQRGDRVRLIIIAPHSAGMTAAVERLDSSARATQHLSGELTGASIELVRELAPHGAIELRVTQSSLTYGAAMVGGFNDTTIYVEHYAYKGGTDAIPKMVVTASDGEWLTFYRTELEELWTHAADVPLKASIP